jgi:hypothetical protein
MVAVIVVVLQGAKQRVEFLKEFNEKLIDGMGLGLALVSPDLTVRHVNRWMTEQFGPEVPGSPPRPARLKALGSGGSLEQAAQPLFGLGYGQDSERSNAVLLGMAAPVEPPPVAPELPEEPLPGHRGAVRLQEEEGPVAPFWQVGKLKAEETIRVDRDRLGTTGPGNALPSRRARPSRWKKRSRTFVCSGVARVSVMPV